MFREVRVAAADGWTLVAASCPVDLPVRAELARGSRLADFARAIITTYPTGSATAPKFIITVRLFVPHHADRSWPRPAPLAVDRSCLADPADADVTVKDVSTGASFT